MTSWVDLTVSICPSVGNELISEEIWSDHYSTCYQSRVYIALKKKRNYFMNDPIA